MAVYNVDKIDNWYNDFIALKNKFNNSYYSNYKSSYIKSSYDSAINKMESSLNKHYLKIEKLYNNINNVWREYLTDLKNVDKRLSGGKGSINAGAVSSKLSKLPTLKEYKRNLTVRIKSVSGVVGTAKVVGWSEDRTVSENLGKSLEIMYSTGAVIATSIVSGLYSLGEDLVDGILWAVTAAVTGVATLFGEEEWAKNAQNTMMDVISFDIVGEVNKAFYENTAIGREINDNSLIKYDSEVAKSIQNASTKFAEIALATGLTIVTGGMAAPLSALIVGGTGFLIGAGNKAQEDFSQEDRNFWKDSGEIAMSGGIKAVEFYSEGQMGAGAIKAIGAIKSAGGVTSFFKSLKTVLSNGESGLFTREAIKKGFKSTLTDVDTYMDSVGAAFDNITYDSEKGLQIDWKNLAKDTACNFALNAVFGFIGNGFETKMESGIKNMELGATAELPKVDVNSKQIGKNASDVNIKKINPNTKIYSDVEISDLKKEYDELLSKSKEQWFINAKEAKDNGWAWNLNEASEVDNIVKRMDELENTLGIKNTGIPESKIYNYSQAKKEADALAEEIGKKSIPGFENIDTSSENYKKAMQDIYSKPSPSGKQDLSQLAFISSDSLLAANTSELDKAILILDKQGGEGYGIKALEHYAKTGSVMQFKDGKWTPYITNNGGTRDFISSLDPENVKLYLEQTLDNNVNNKLIKALSALDKQGGEGYGIKALEHYAKTGSVMQFKDGKWTPYITNNEGTRDFISGLDAERVKKFLLNFRNTDTKNMEAINLFKNQAVLSKHFSENQILEAFSNFHTYSTEQEFLEAAGYRLAQQYGLGGLHGFNRGNEIHINPRFDDIHTRVHEALHNITSEFDSSGKKVVTGFERFGEISSGNYLNGGVIFNEGATDYLTHKIVGDGCKSGDYYNSFKFFEEMDSIFEDMYGPNDILFDSYVSHDVTFIRNFVNKYGDNNFDKIAKIEFLNKSEINEILDKIRKNVGKELNPSAMKKMSNKLKNIFGG